VPNTKSHSLSLRLLLAGGILAPFLCGQTAPKITSPREALGFNIGDDYHVANYSQLATYWKTIASECNRCKLVEIGKTAEGRPQYMMIISSPENIRNLEHYKAISQKLAHAEGLTDAQAHALAREGKPVIWIDGGLHASETVGSQQLMEMVYQMASRTDPETVHLLNDVIGLYVQANPDGQEFVANWYMREKDETKRSLQGLPKLYNKYIGHDDNRDFYMSNMPETTNMNRQMFIEWFPQIVYNHHQTGPAGAVIFMPPFRDPFNYNLDPLIPLGIEGVGTAMHSRLVEEGRGGSAMRSGANYSTWWNGGLRTIPYFHNMIGLLTEIIGDPTPMKVSLVAAKQLPTGDWPMPVAPQEWHYRQSIDYEMENNRAVLDYAARQHEVLLYNLYRMGANSIEKGSRDNWTITPKRINALIAAAAQEKGAVGHDKSMEAPAAGDAMMSPGGIGMPTLPPDLYQKVLHDPAHRDPRGYIIPSDQADFATATEFVDALLKTGITVMRATSSFQVAGKSYPAGSYVVKTAQAFRPHVMDMFEPQDHPNDFRYPGGPPIPPYDITGWTLAMQMGVQYDRELDGFDGPFQPVKGLLDPPAGKIIGPANPAGYLISHRINNSFKLVNRLLKANADVYWMDKSLEADGQDLGTGTIWVPASAAVLPVLEKGAQEFGIDIHAVSSAPKGEAYKLKPIRIGLYDQYGGLMPTGWIRWIFEQYEFPFEMVYPKTLDAGDLKSKFDVLVFADGAFRVGTGGRGGAGLFANRIPDDVPAEYQERLGKLTVEKTVPQIKKFVESGGSVVTIGSSARMGELLGVPVTNYLTEKGPDGKDRPLPAEKFYIPGSLLRANIDNTSPIAFGMPPQVDVMFDNSPVFKMDPNAAQKHGSAVGWFSGSDVVDSGWAWGKQYLDGGAAIATAKVGEGNVTLLGPEVTFRGQPHGTYKLLFNGVYSGSAKATTIE
jgi:Zinc carboxypeptidase